MKKIIKVKDLEVTVSETKLSFNKDGHNIEIERKLGQSDYRLVYNYLKLKNPGQDKEFYNVGNFFYKKGENSFTVYNIVGEVIGETQYLNVELNEQKNPNQFLRNKVINYLLTQLR